MRNRARLPGPLPGPFVVLLLAGCALGPDVVAIRPAPPSVPAATVLRDARPAAVSAAMAPGLDPQRVGTRRNGYGMATGTLFADPPVPAAVAAALQGALGRRGVPSGPGGAAVAVTVLRFATDFSPGLFSSASDSAVRLAVRVTVPDGGAPAYSGTVSGRDHRDGLLLMTPLAARRGLERALNDALGRLLVDPGFVAALRSRPAAER